MLSRFAAVAPLGLLLALLPNASAQSCASGPQQYNTASVYQPPHACMPSGFFQAQDLGQTNQADLTSRCSAQCTSLGAKCQAFAGQLWKAADSNLMTGQCYFYTVLPAAPTYCVDAPTIILAQSKDNSLQCLSSSAAAATPYCSSYLSLGTVTQYTKTVTPTITSTITRSSTTQTVVPTHKTENDQTSTSYTLTSTIVPPASTLTFYDYATTNIPSVTTVTVQGVNQKRGVTPISPPGCLTTASLPASRISSACSCLSVTSTTLRTTSTAPPTTTYTTITTWSTITQYSTFTSTTTLLTLTSTTAATQTTSFTSYTSTSTILSVSTATSCGNAISNPGFESNAISPPWQVSPVYWDRGGGSGSLAPHGGRAYLDVNPCSGCFNDSPSAVSITQTVTVCPNTSYRFSFWYAYKLHDTTKGYSCTLQVCNSNDCAYFSLTPGASYSQHDWYLLNLRPFYTDSASSVQLSVKTLTGSTCTFAQIEFDDFSFSPV